MSFWRITMRRSISLSRTYIILGVAISVYGIIISNILALIPASSANPASTPIDLMNVFPILSVAILPLSALLFSLPVVMLFVYDKNNGVFEYLLSTGFDQLDIFKGYVKASLLLASSLLVFSCALNAAVGIYMGTNLGFLATITALAFAIGVSVVFLVTVAMMAFSSLQKTPTGANQPLGVIIGIVPVLPALILPIAFPSYALLIDIAIAAATLLISAAMLLSVDRIILREKLLP
ncbi:MAG TPA: hypothetical protein VJ574_00385 [Candidatus Bathyarchaeia archaeon]|nr:hypothetical protein [Candidatus Bathyarchaeia archaeon]